MVKKLLIIAFICLLAVVSEAKKISKAPVEEDTDGDVSLALTHILPSTAVIPGGHYVIGTTVGFGLLDFIDFSTNIVYDVEGAFNVGSKIALYHDHNVAFAPNVQFITGGITETDPITGNQTNVTYTSWNPGATLSYRLSSGITGHTGGMIALQNPKIPKNTVQNPRTALVQGNTLNQEFTFGLARTLALAMGGSYDTTYDIAGAGASVHLSGLHIGLHYYFNVGQGSLMPIVAGGFSSTF